MQAYMVAILFLLINGGFAETTSLQLASITSLMKWTNFFNLRDFDDDGFLEYTDEQDHFRRVDINGDGIASHQEIHGDSAGEEASETDFQILDATSDGKITMVDIEMFYFELAREYGNDVNLKDYLEYCLLQLPPQASGVTVKAFVSARRNFLITDVDDNNKVSKKEVKSEFRVADYDKDNKLSKLELDGLNLLRNVDVSEYCTNATVGCPVEDFLVIFDQADRDGDDALTLKEYLMKFGELTKST
ncbi:hypothetical protein SNE40_004567 [Patella caerulea]|uniref:EF-hand domain-containing protein n=1 Tax=Patella caerulea TaxID=87958 RepID=A0AAN8KC63_PATCE